MEYVRLVYWFIWMLDPTSWITRCIWICWFGNRWCWISMNPSRWRSWADPRSGIDWSLFASAFNQKLQLQMMVDIVIFWILSVENMKHRRNWVWTNPNFMEIFWSLMIFGLDLIPRGSINKRHLFNQSLDISIS